MLAELTQTFDQPASYFFPLMAHVERRLGHKPRYGALDMGFDAHYIYDYFQQAGGFAAVPLAERGDTSRQFDAAGLPVCPAGLVMPRKGVFTCHTSRFEQQRGRYACPLRYPMPTGAACPSADPHWATGGCLVTMPTSSGARIRYQLDRESEEFKAIYKQRTADERINSPAPGATSLPLPSTSNAPPMNGSTARRSNSALSGPNCATARRSSTRTP